jgi:hypothetical protein
VTVAQNTAAGGTVTASTDDHPGQGLGGGIFDLDGSVTMVSTTIAQNTAGDGGALYALADKRVNSGSGSAYDASVNLVDSVLADDGAATHDVVIHALGSPSTATAALTLGDANVVPKSAIDPTFTGSLKATDPGLTGVSLNDNGGPGMATLRPPLGSSMLGAGGSNAAAIDERGFADANPPDLGALQSQRPAISDPAAIATSPTTAALAATVTSRFAGTLAARAGTTESSESSAGSPAAFGQGANGTFAIDLTGLSPATTYHYALMATSSEGTATTAPADLTFTTPPLPQPPAETASPAITGTAKAGKRLTCTTGTWTNSPTHYAYQWLRDGTPVRGATGSTYTVQTGDEGVALTCTVTASNGVGNGKPATSKAVDVAVPHVRRCPAASGRLSGRTLGLVRLGMTKAQARHAYTHSSTRGFSYKDFFCLTPRGVRVGYASPKLLASLPRRDRGQIAGRVVWASTDNVRYDVRGIRAGATLTAAQHALRHGYYFRVGKNYWYLAPAGTATAVLKVRQGVVEEVGIADTRLTTSHRADRLLMTSFY